MTRQFARRFVLAATGSNLSPRAAFAGFFATTPSLTLFVRESAS